MRTTEILTILLLTIGLIISGLLVEIGFFRYLYFPICWAIILILTYRNRLGIIAAGIVLVIGDLILGLPVGGGPIAIAASGLMISLINKIWPIFRSQPFWIARYLWLIIALTIIIITQFELKISAQPEVIAKIFLVNLVAFSLLSILVNKLGSAKARYADIVIK